MRNRKKHVILKKLSFAMLVMLCLTACGGSKAPSEKVISEDLKAALAEKHYFTNMFYTRRFYMYQPQDAASYFSFGCCILAGTVIACLTL